ncbi:MAG TPA: hypothetical protein VFH11_13970, partial [Gemmatimonadota bacterium]|nr:hypothetical protein [Gemmatimonadota bacterium]
MRPSAETPLLALVALLVAAGAARAQEAIVPPPDTAAQLGAVEPAAPDPDAVALQAAGGDRIMAVVGSNLLLESEWREQTEVLATQLGVDPAS